MGKLAYYKCREELHAYPMTRGEYLAHQKLHGAPCELDEEGYLITRNIFTKDEDESWLSKKVFEKGCTEIDGSPLERLQEEYQELVIKQEKLGKLLGDGVRPKDSPISPKQWELLVKQYQTMIPYSSVLKERLDKWSD